MSQECSFNTITAHLQISTRDTASHIAGHTNPKPIYAIPTLYKVYPTSNMGKIALDVHFLVYHLFALPHKCRGLITQVVSAHHDEVTPNAIDHRAFIAYTKQVTYSTWCIWHQLPPVSN